VKIFENLWNIWIDLFRQNKKKELTPKPEPNPIIIEKPKPEPDPIILEKDFSAVAGKGAFLYDLSPLYAEFGSSAGIAAWLKSLGMNNAWMRIVGKAGWSSTQTKAQAKNLIRECNEIGVKVGAWGYIYNSQPEKYADYVVQYVQELGLDCFIHNAEKEWEGNKKQMEILAERYWKVINENLPSNIVHGLSTFWNPDLHSNFPYSVFMKYCSVNCPQIYHVLKDPVPVLKKGIELNSRFNKPLVITTQFFWNELGITEQTATRDVIIMCEKWNTDLKDIVLNNKVIGFNHWYCGGKGAHAFNETMRKEYSNFSPILTNFKI